MVDAFLRERAEKSSCNRHVLFRIAKAWITNMLHAKSLRVIGQLLEAAGIAAFELEKNDQYYVVSSASVTTPGEWILRDALRNNDFSSKCNRQSTANRPFFFPPANILRLDAQAQKKRRNHSFSVIR